MHGVLRTGAAVACRRARRRVARIEQSSSQMAPAQPRMQAQEKAIDDNGSDFDESEHVTLCRCTHLLSSQVESVSCMVFDAQGSCLVTGGTDGPSGPNI